MRPWERYWFNLHRNNTRSRKDRQLHHIERALLIWPLHAYMWVKRRRTPQTITAPKGAFFMHENSQEDS